MVYKNFLKVTSHIYVIKFGGNYETMTALVANGR